MPSNVDDVTMREVALYVLGALGMAWYFLCLFRIGKFPTATDKNGLRQFQEMSVTTISTILATFVGVVLGLQGISGKTDTTKKVVEEIRPPIAHMEKAAPGQPPPAAARVKEAVEKTDEATKRLDDLIRATTPSPVQWVVFFAYLLSLCVALYFWYYSPPNEDPNPVIVSLAKSLLGVIGGALTALLTLRTI